MKLWQNKNFRTLVWQVFNAIVAFGTSYITGLDNTYVPFMMLVLNQVSKWINTKYFGDLWVSK